MLRGRFGNTTGRPYLEGRLSRPRLRIVGDVSFLVDTGADRSAVMPIDGIRLGIDYARLAGGMAATGIGGSARLFSERAEIGFLDGTTTIHVYQIVIGIAGPTRNSTNIPSLLGRDVLDRWRMSYNPSKGTLTFKVLSADQTITS